MRRFYSYLKSKYRDASFRSNLKTDMLRSKEIILVHQMGKVGSSSIVKSLGAMQLDIPIYHTHFLNSERLENQLNHVRTNGRKPEKHLIVSKCLQEVISKGKNDRSWKIVTLVREPISRNISAFFENINIFLPDFVQRYHSGSLKIDEVIDVFLASYPHELPLNWLDWEIKSVFGIDVFSVDFPKLEGYILLHNDNVDLLLLRLENLANCLQIAFRKFLQAEDFIIKNANIANDKDYINAYKDFKDSIVLPQDYIDKMYTSKYMQHFYSEEEIDNFRAKWFKPS